MAGETMPLSQQVRPPRDHGLSALTLADALSHFPFSLPVRSFSQEEVAICMTAIRELLAQPDLAAMFGAPVDVKALDGYLTVVERPMDLKTICDAASSYHSYKLVLKDVRLVWQNCTAYWGQASKKDDPTGVLLLDMCEKARGFFKAAFDRACRARGVRLLDPALAGVVHAQQQFVGSVQRGGSNGNGDGGPSTSPRELKIVDLDLFTVYAVSPDSESDGEHTDSEPFDLVGLAQQRVSGGEMSVQISGTLQAARKKSTISLSLVKDAAKNEPPKTVEGEEVLDWVVGWSTGVGNAGTNNVTGEKRAIVYVVTPNVWYRLNRPAEGYKETYQNVRTGVELVEVASRRAEVAGEVPDVSGIVEAVAKEMRSGLVVKVADAEAGGVGAGSQAGAAKSDITEKRLPGRNVPAHVKKFAIGHMEGLYGQRVDALSRYGYLAMDVDGVDDEQLERMGIDLDTEVARMKEDRGPPPEMDARWRVPKEKVHELLFLWGFLQEFGAILKLAPCTLGTLEAALCPGPTIDMAIDEVSFKAEDAKELERIRAEARAKEKEREKEMMASLAAGAAPVDRDVDMDDATAFGGRSGYRSNGHDCVEGVDGLDGLDGIKNEDLDIDTVPRSDAGRPVKREDGAEERRGPNDDALKDDGANATARAQRGASLNANKFDEEFMLDVDSIFDDDDQGELDDYQPSKRRKSIKIQRNPMTSTDAGFGGPASAPSGQAGAGPPGPTPEEAAAALEEAKRKQAAHEASVIEKYGVSWDIVSKATVVDRLYSPSGVLIRDIVLALLSVVDETLVIPKGKQEPKRPNQASTYVARSHKLLWPAALANTVWSYELSTEQLKETALRLAYGDFVDLSAAERIDMLCALVYEIIESPLLANAIAKRADEYAQFHAERPAWGCIKPHGVDMAQSLQKEIAEESIEQLKKSIVVNAEENKGSSRGRRRKAAVDDADADADADAQDGDMDDENDADADEDKGVTEKAKQEPQPTISGPMSRWLAWLEVLGLGTLAPVGDDANGRRYWAIGQDAGAFRVYCQVIDNDEKNMDTWGWYEGDRLDQLVNWLKLSDIRSERQLVAALSSAPRSTAGKSTKLIESSRHDGYRSITSPLLRGEFNHCNTKPASLTMDQRSSRAVEVMLGSISFWFDEELTKKIVGISDVLIKGQPSACSKVLLEADRLLIDAGRTTQEWVDLWSPNWRQTAVSLSSTLDVLLHVSAMQKHVCVEDEVLSRIVFLKLLEEMHTNQRIPRPDDEVSVSRTLVLQHIDKAMHLIGFTKKPIKLKVADADTDADADAEDGKIEEEDAAAILGLLAGKLTVHGVNCVIQNPLIREESLEKIRSQWQGLRDRVANMKRIEQFSVRCVTYRKSLLDSTDLNVAAKTASEEELANIRQPVAWVTLKPAPYALPSEMATSLITVPLVLHKDLEDFCPEAKQYKRSMRIGWMPKDRFKVKATGWERGWHKGTVLDNYAPQNLYIPGSRDSGEDPCHSILVSFDDGPDGNQHRVSPWKLHIDVDEERAAVNRCNKQEKTVERSMRRTASGACKERDRLELEQQQADLEEARRRKQRANDLIAKADREKDAETIPNPLEVPNTDYYGSSVQEQHINFLHSIGDQLYGKYAASTKPRAKSGTKSEARSERITAYPTGPLKSGQQVPDEILDWLRDLTKEQFLCMLENFYVGLKGRFKTPTFAHRELDLHRVWWSVMDRNGYESVSAQKQWRDVAKSLNVNLTGQTSASFNMRLNYERCLLDFENYLCCGQYDEDASNNKAPVHTHRTDPATTRFVIPGAYLEDQLRLDAAKLRQTLERSSKDGSMGMETAKSTATGGAVGAGGGGTGGTSQAGTSKGVTPKSGLSLKLKLSVKSPGGSSVGSPTVASPTAAGKLKIKLKTGGGASSNLGGGNSSSKPSPFAADVAAPAPPSAAATTPTDNPGLAALTDAAVATANDEKDNNDLHLGQSLSNMGTEAIGIKIQLYWPDDGGWWNAEIIAFNPTSGEHQIVYNKGSDDESFELVNLGKLDPKELRRI